MDEVSPIAPDALLDELAAFLARTESVVERAQAIQALRAREGRTIGKASLAGLAKLAPALGDLARSLGGLLADPAAEHHEAARREIEAFRRLENR